MAPSPLNSRPVMARIIYDDGQEFSLRAVEEVDTVEGDGMLHGVEEYSLTTVSAIPFELLGVTATVTVGGLARRMFSTDCRRFVLSTN